MVLSASVFKNLLRLGDVCVILILSPFLTGLDAAAFHSATWMVEVSSRTWIFLTGLVAVCVTVEYWYIARRVYNDDISIYGTFVDCNINNN